MPSFLSHIVHSHELFMERRRVFLESLPPRSGPSPLNIKSLKDPRFGEMYDPTVNREKDVIGNLSNIKFLRAEEDRDMQRKRAEAEIDLLERMERGGGGRSEAGNSGPQTVINNTIDLGFGKELVASMRQEMQALVTGMRAEFLQVKQEMKAALEGAKGDMRKQVKEGMQASLRRS